MSSEDEALNDLGLGVETDKRTDAQRINCTFWDNMEEAGIGFDDRVKVLSAMSEALETHFATLYIP